MTKNLAYIDGRHVSQEEMPGMLLGLALKHQLLGHRILPKALEKQELHYLTGYLTVLLVDVNDKEGLCNETSMSRRGLLHRRMKIAEKIDALGELFPCSKQGGKASQMDEIIDHIKYLQFQMKGCGHYILDEQQIEPLEDTMGKLLELNPSMATQLLESKGLFVMPMALAEGLHYHE
ncbi:hypothetical protein H5410_047503 [Solanum commersonii]|uniref:BHLH domain-containing protein n=1 Tax=Solanum commersonii TaxID=4109 RepID=A0A9J5XH83_SOLCO|nr:hypothetical protein H5410_047503 [Solanum commersonii]